GLLVGHATDQRIQIARLELVRVAGQRADVADAKIARAGPEEVVEGQGAEGGVAAGAAAANRHTVAVRAPPAHQIAGAVNAVGHVQYAPVALQLFAVFAPVTGASPVINVQHGNTPAGPELDAEFKGRSSTAGRPAVAVDQQWGQLAGRRPVILVLGWVVIGVGRPAVTGGKLNGLRDGEVAGRNVETAHFTQRFDLLRPQVHADNSRRFGRRTGAHDGEIAGNLNPAQLGVGHQHGREEPLVGLQQAKLPAPALKVERDDA